MESSPFNQWNDFFVAEAGASAALAGLLFVAVSINLAQILKFSHLPTRAIEALATVLAVLVMSTFALVPGQSPFALGVEITVTALILWVIQLIALLKTRGSGYETALRLVLNQVPPIPFVIAGVLVCIGTPTAMYWMVPGTLLCILSGVYCAWILLVEIQR
jgi:hypothetical protein